MSKNELSVEDEEMIKEAGETLPKVSSKATTESSMESLHGG